MKNFWNVGNGFCGLLIVLVMLFLGGCLGHEANTTGSTTKKDIDLVIDSGGGIQYLYAPTVIHTYNSQSANQKTDNDPSSSLEGNLGWNGGAVSKDAEGGSAAAEGISTISKLLALGNEDKDKPVDIQPLPIVSPVVKPEPPAGSTVELLDYHGRTNGTGDPDDRTDPKNRPTWYGKKDFSEYPSPMRVVIQGCFDEVIGHDGVRYYPDGMNGLLVKQSDVSGRGMSILYSNTCMSKTATIEY